MKTNNIPSAFQVSGALIFGIRLAHVLKVRSAGSPLGRLPEFLQSERSGRVWVIFLCVLLSGCVQVFPDPGVAPQIVQLQPKTETGKNLPLKAWSLGIEEPFADDVLNSAKIPIKIEADGKASYFSSISGKEWRTRLPLMLQDLMVASFEKTRRVANGVARTSQSVKFDRILITDVNHCEFSLSESREGALAHVRLTAKLTLSPERRIIASKTFEETAASSTQEFASMLAALESASGRLLSNLTAWVLEQK